MKNNPDTGSTFLSPAARLGMKALVATTLLSAPAQAASQADIDAVMKCATTAQSGTTLEMKHPSPSGHNFSGKAHTKDGRVVEFGVTTTDRGASNLRVNNEQYFFFDGVSDPNSIVTPDGIPDSVIDDSGHRRVRGEGEVARARQPQFDGLVADVRGACESNIVIKKQKSE